MAETKTSQVFGVIGGSGVYYLKGFISEHIRLKCTCLIPQLGKLHKQLYTHHQKYHGFYRKRALSKTS